MQLTIKKTGVEHLVALERVTKKLASTAWKREAARGVTDAGRVTRTKVQKAVAKQMNVKRYAEVSGNVRGVSDAADMSFTISSVRGGQRLEVYKGLRIRKGGAAEENQAASGKVTSAVWGRSRVFQRSFGTEAGTFAVLPGASSTIAPQALWTYGAKKNQGRDDAGRFTSAGIRYGKIRRLAGPALRDELGKDESLATFYREAPVLLQQRVEKRLMKFIEF